MKTTKDYMADVRAHVEALGMNASKYRMARELGVSDLTVSYWMTGRTMDDDSALRVAAYLKRPPAELLLAMAHERARSPEARKTWARAAKALAGTAVALLLGCSGVFDITVIMPPSSAHAADLQYTLCAVWFIAGLAKTAVCGIFFASLLTWTSRTCSGNSSSACPI